ncbi:MAG TPA: RidA family protein [Dongiaceae bacterium]|nr:RidA family protein [Dongiaceae bacterium]
MLARLAHRGRDRLAFAHLDHVLHINIFPKEMRDFEAMNTGCVEMMGIHRPARSVIGISELPKSGVRLTMNPTAAVKD